MAKLNSKESTPVKERNVFDLSHDGVFSCSWGDIVPILCQEMVPGDTFECDANVFVRMAALASPTYGQMHGYINYFFVPNRILLQDGLWDDFMRRGVDGLTSYTLPFIQMGDFKKLYDSWLDGSYDDYTVNLINKFPTFFRLAAPSMVDVNCAFKISMLPFAAYNRIYGDYYFPWSVEDDADVEQIYFKKLGQGRVNPVDSTDSEVFWGKYLSLKRACFKKDYVTTALTRPQRGQQVFAPYLDSTQVSSVGGVVVNPDNDGINTSPSRGVSSLAIRWATSFQKYLERNNIAGARYFEQVLARFGVKLKDELLQRSLYLGGNDFLTGVKDVTSTSATSGANLGDVAGKGIASGNGKVSFTNNSSDYGFFIALFHFMPESNIVQGIPRMFCRQDPLDYFTPEMEDTGCQPLYLPEVWQDYTFARTPTLTQLNETGVFGYVPRYSEYKFATPLLAGDFRIWPDSTLVPGGDLASMHLYRLFNSGLTPGVSEDLPTLSTDWLTLTPDKDFEFNRIFQDTNSDFDHFWCNLQVSLTAYRPMIGYEEGAMTYVHEDKGPKVSIPYGGVRL